VAESNIVAESRMGKMGKMFSQRGKAKTDFD